MRRGRARWGTVLPVVPLRIEAAAYRGKPVSFAIIGPWTEAARMLVVLALMAAQWLLSEHHVPTFWEVGLATMFVSWSLFVAALLWVLYVALEPFVRRRWPQILVSWTRLLSGDWRDPLVGRDVLVGAAAGVVSACGVRLVLLVPPWLGDSEVPHAASRVLLEALTGTRQHVSVLLQDLVGGIAFGLILLFLLCFLRILLRREWLAAAVWVVVMSLPGAISSEAPLLLAATGFGAMTGLDYVVLGRFGLTAMVVSGFADGLFARSPMTFHASAWYAGMGFVALFVFAAVTAYGFWTSLGGRPLVSIRGFDD